MTVFNDKRFSTNRNSADNRRRYIDRARRNMLEGVTDEFDRSDFEDLIADNATLGIIFNGLDEPSFCHSNQGKRKTVYPGNKYFSVGDRLMKPKKAGQGKGQCALILDSDELLDILFGNCELPDFLKKSRMEVSEQFMERYGYSKNGSPSRLSLLKSYQQSVLRRVALEAVITNDDETDDEEKEEKRKKILFIDNGDLRYRYITPRPKPVKAGLMCMLFDVSGSITDVMRRQAKLFFYLLYRFLKTKYDKIELLPILHSDEAEIVPINDFFNTNWRGSTEFEPAYTLLADEIDKRDWENLNIYVCHFSDSDVYDLRKALQVANERISGKVNMFLYGHLGSGMAGLSVMSKMYEEAVNGTVVHVPDDGDVAEIFLEVFKKRG